MSSEDKNFRNEGGNETTRRAFIVAAGASTIVSFSPFGIPAAQSARAHEASQPELTLSEEYANMPLVRFDAVEGRSDPEIKTLLDSAHRAIVKAFHINERDRYQIYTARPKARFVMQDTGLGIQRSDKMLIITIFSKARSEILKRRLYQEMTEELARSASIPKSDVMICIIENSAADWTFGNGEPQFLTGDLA